MNELIEFVVKCEALNRANKPDYFVGTLNLTALAELIEAKQAERIANLEAALTRLRDCDWVISLPDRMDAVRNIAKEALNKG